MFQCKYKNKRVLITGHTGFKGAWLTAWLLKLGANVAGYSIDLPTQPALFEILGLKNKIEHYTADVCDLEQLKRVFDKFKPEIVFHLAAQSLVAKSYKDPHQTFSTNAIGTLNVMECIRTSKDIKAAVMITSDKAYRNVEWDYGYRETDAVGGEDPYSGSKGCAELICYSYFNSFFNNLSTPMLATARAGNVIGGGDWAENRIVPDCMRAWADNKAVEIRSPYATRPWQHVLEPLSGYLWLGAQLLSGNKKTKNQSFNFGPDSNSENSVVDLIAALAIHWPYAEKEIKQSTYGAEATLLKLCCDKALRQLAWQPTLSFKQTVALTAKWYEQFYRHHDVDMYQFTLEQIDQYIELAVQKECVWSKSLFATI